MNPQRWAFKQLKRYKTKELQHLKFISSSMVSYLLNLYQGLTILKARVLVSFGKSMSKLIQFIQH